MTYPYPQGGYNPQDPYNQGGGYPQSGGFPAQGGYPQTGGFPQQPGGFPQQPGGGYPPGPPKKSNTALIVSIVAVVVLALGALGITGFVAPGFFLSSDDEGGGDGGGPASGPQAVAQQIVAALNAKDTAQLQSLKCSNADEDVDEVIGRVQELQSATLGEVKKDEDGDRPFEVWVAQVTVVVGGQPMQAEGFVGNPEGKWCWGDVDLGGSSSGTSTAPSIPPIDQSAPPIDPSGGAGGGVSGSFQTVMDDFKSKVNSGDSAGAKAMACSANSTSVSSTVDTATSGSASVSLTGTPTGSETSNMLYDLTGTLNGSSAEGLLGVNSTDGGSTWCVDYFSFY